MPDFVPLLVLQTAADLPTSPYIAGEICIELTSSRGTVTVRVPLSRQAVELLAQLPQVQGNTHVFPGACYSRPLSNMAMLQLMRGMGYGVGGERGDYVPHGFRSSFRDWKGEVTSYPRDVAEIALAHTIENKVEAAYRRGDLFEKRLAMMQEWEIYIS